jgi:hypothetical protein
MSHAVNVVPTFEPINIGILFENAIRFESTSATIIELTALLD